MGDLRDAAFRLALEHAEKLPSSAVIHDQEKVVGTLETVVERYNEGVIHRREDFALREAPLELSPSRAQASRHIISQHQLVVSQINHQQVQWALPCTDLVARNHLLL